MDKQLINITLASLLHDIGKFKQRACGSNKDELQNSSEMEGQLLPDKNSYYSHQHALWTFNFFETDLDNILQNNIKLNSLFDWKQIRDLASYHHKPRDADCGIIAEADRRSAAMDRDSKDKDSKDRDSEQKYEKGDYLKKHLKSVFTSINLVNMEKKCDVYGYNLAPLDAKTLFPIIVNDNEDLTGKYKTLWNSFLAELPRLPAEPLLFVQCLGKLLEKYTWCIPAATNDPACDVSLYDHALTTAALAIALKCHASEQGNKEEKELLFFTGDLSGIQKFIFQNQKENCKGNAKIIRARSFYLSVINQAYYQYLMQTLDIPPFTCIMNTGGSFIALLPNTEKVKKQLDRITGEVDNWFFNTFFGEFSLIYDYSVTAGRNDFKQDQFKKILNDINYNLAAAKNNKFRRFLVNGECVIDVDYNEKGICKACGCRNKKFDEEEAKCQFCSNLQNIGKDITTKKFFALQRKGDVDFFDEKIAVCFADSTADFNDPVAVYSLAGEDPVFPTWPLNNYVPKDKLGDTMMFEEIAEQALGPEKDGMKNGSAFLAFIKADVDNLGAIFTIGMEKVSVSRYVNMSRMLNLFFNYFVKQKLQHDYKNFYTVLSGGDDLFLIAPWNRTIDFIRELHESFSRYVCHNQDIHFSAGVEINKPQHPINAAADNAEKHLESAKAAAGKNCIWYFRLLQYKDLMIIHDWVKWFLEISQDEVTTGFLYRLLAYVRDAIAFKVDKNKNISRLVYIPKFRYDVARNIIKTRDGIIINEQLVNKLVKMFDSFTKDNPELLEIILKITLYEKRERKVKEINE